MLGNNVCDSVCNYDHCAWDGGDCRNLPKRLRPKDIDKAHCDFTTSIYYTNAVYNRAFVPKERHLFAHAPVFIDKRVNDDMVKRFSTEIKETCSHRVRSNMDFQFGFSYMNFLMEGNNNSNKFVPITKSKDVAFLGVDLNEAQTIKHLSALKKNIRKHKFVCINDDIDYSKQSAADKAVSLLEECYGSLFPNPSSFETSK
ncbi:N-acetylglucosamine-1-phosphotransferase subunits alpha/beta-like [Mercenaria mercenaria]|uniref:N-acetylglucosamine-1-phosphotransferase subunits alpha/beta-like n=1 Tax=Mercenaria mercenaria TaxID=6596 RepID=UPI00234E84A0|nr:N-acetylglucosamine-1-phosphotransferase subunits alpha/beta-like [Mercenaria mercenaria]